MGKGKCDNPSVIVVLFFGVVYSGKFLDGSKEATELSTDAQYSLVNASNFT